MLLLIGASALGQSSVGAPRAGCTVDAGRHFRIVWGMRGNFILGEAALDGVESAACSARFSIAKTAEALVVLDQGGAEVSRVSSPRGPALFAFDRDGSPAYALFQGKGGTSPKTSALLKWDDGEWRPVAVAWRGEALSIADDSNGGLLVLTSASLIRVLRGVVSVVRRFDSAAASGYVDSDGSAVFGDSLGTVTSITRFGDDGLRASTADGEFLLDPRSALPPQLLPGAVR